MSWYFVRMPLSVAVVDSICRRTVLIAKYNFELHRFETLGSEGNALDYPEIIYGDQYDGWISSEFGVH